MPIERLTTKRLIVRRLFPEDAADVQRLAGDWEVARTLARVPHPYEDGMAERWIESVSNGFETGESYVFAIERRRDARFLGIISLERGDGGEYMLGYWLGRPYWRHGYMSEAAMRVLRFGFEECDMTRIVATAQPTNLASIAVLTKLGMIVQGRAIKDLPARGERLQVVLFACDREIDATNACG
ncbi:MAG: GNAT family N-acetyltransferase [Alphaproteobacteria bacterium]